MNGRWRIFWLVWCLWFAFQSGARAIVHDDRWAAFWAGLNLMCAIVWAAELIGERYAARRHKEAQ